MKVSRELHTSATCTHKERTLNMTVSGSRLILGGGEKSQCSSQELELWPCSSQQISVLTELS
jgi:hypothetical protein